MSYEHVFFTDLDGATNLLSGIATRFKEAVEEYRSYNEKEEFLDVDIIFQDTLEQIVGFILHHEGSSDCLHTKIEFRECDVYVYLYGDKYKLGDGAFYLIQG